VDKVHKLYHLSEYINMSLNKPNKCTNVTITFLHTICQNSDMFQSILIIFRDLLNINIVYVKHRYIMKYIKICT